MFKIMVKYRAYSDEIDQCNTKEEAEKLLIKYQVSLGPTWTVWITP